MSDTVLVGIVGVAGALLGVVVSSGIQVFISRQTDRQQVERDDVAYARRVADAKRERLIRRYEDASRAAETYFSLSRKMMFMSKDQMSSLADDDQRGFEALQDVKASLALEDDTDDVIKLCDQLQADFFMFKVDAVRGDFRNESLDKTIIALREAIRTHLKALESPARPHEFRTNGQLRLGLSLQRRK